MKKKNFNLLLEIGTEELPSTDVWAAIEQIKERAPHLLRGQGIKTGKVSVYSTPRRLVIYIKKVAQISDKQLKQLLISFIKSLKFEKTMRWLPHNQLVFSRPIRWLVALADERLINIEYAKVKSSKTSFGPRFLLAPKIKIKSSDEYFKQIKEHKIIIDHQKRKEMILRQSRSLVAKVKGKIIEDKELLDEIVQLVEYPLCILCQFDKRFLKIPRQVAVMVMKKHQRYFPVVDSKGKLLPYFIVVANQLKENSPIIRDGNEKVISARLADGEFFYNQDREYKLEYFRTGLKDIVFHEKLGSVYDKSQRIEKMMPALAKVFNLNKQEEQAIKRAAYLSKADLATNLVGEFTELEGKIGQIYAQKDKEKKSVAQAIFEHRLPRFSGDKLPVSKLGQVLSIADKIDTLAGFFAVGISPKGSQDPYALRRAASGLAQVLIVINQDIELSGLFRQAGQFLPVKLKDKTVKDLVNFVKERVKADFKEEGISDDIIRAVIEGPMGENLYAACQIINELPDLKNKNQFKNFVQAAKRVQNITKDISLIGNIDKKLLKEKTEQELYRAYLQTKKSFEHFIKERQFKKAIDSYQGLTKHIEKFFEDVLVMTKDRKLQKNRLLLLRHIHQLFNELFKSGDLVVK